MNVKPISFLSFPDMGKRIFTLTSPSKVLTKGYSLLPLLPKHSVSFPGIGKRIFTFHSPTQSLEKEYSLLPLSKALAKGYSHVPVLPSRWKKGYSIFTLLQMCQEQDIYCSLFFPGFSYPFQSSYKGYSLFPRIKSFPSREAGSHSEYHAKSLTFQGKV